MKLFSTMNFGLSASFTIALWLALDSLALGLTLGIASSLAISRLRQIHSGDGND